MRRFLLTSLVVLSLSGRVLAQAPPDPNADDLKGSGGPFPAVTFGVQTFLEYAAELHEQNSYNAFDVTRGYLNIQARLNRTTGVSVVPPSALRSSAVLPRHRRSYPVDTLRAC